MCECFGGEPIEFENLRSPEQQAMMQGLYHSMVTGLQQGATPYPGQLSAPMTNPQFAAMKQMMDVGGYGYKPQFPQYRSVPQTNVPLLDIPGLGGGSQTTNAGTQTSQIDPAQDPKFIGFLNEMLGGGGGGGGFKFDPENRSRDKKTRRA